MTQLERLKRRIPQEQDDSLLCELLDSAKNVILGLRFPFGDWPTELQSGSDGKLEEVTVLESRYLDLQIRMALDLYNKIGAEGELVHSENGVSRHYESSWIAKELRNEVIPMAKGLGT